MYKAIIVDDEKWIVEGIKVGVNWNEYGFVVVGEAENGLEALQLIEKWQPDFVLTDIKMPGMNGLELIKKGKEASPDTIYVVLSAHAEFAYAQKALNYGTFGYCLKPFEIDEINSMLSRVAAALTDRRKTVPAASAELYEAICSGRAELVKQMLEDSGMPATESSPIIPIVILSSDPLSLTPDTKHLFFQMGMNRQGCLVYEQQAESFLAYVRQAYGARTFSAGVGYPVSNIKELDTSLEAAALAAYGCFPTGKSGIYSYPSTTNRLFEESLKAIAGAVNRKDRILFISCMNEARARFLDGSYTMKDAYLLFTALMCLFYLDGHASTGRMFEGYEQLYYHFGQADAMIDYLMEHTLDYFAEEQSERLAEISHKTIREILKYIDQHFTQDISIQALSERFFLSPNYLCYLFKKEVGENFIEYISRLRIQYACKLLVETDYPIHQVGARCGFNDYFYFTRIFKRMNQMTPTQYRERMMTQ